MDLDLVRQKLETLGTVRVLEEKNNKLHISINDITPSTELIFKFLTIYNDEIYETYNSEEALVNEGVSLKAIYYNVEGMEDIRPTLFPNSTVEIVGLDGSVLQTVTQVNTEAEVNLEVPVFHDHTPIPDTSVEQPMILKYDTRLTSSNSSIGADNTLNLNFNLFKGGVDWGDGKGIQRYSRENSSERYRLINTEYDEPGIKIIKIYGMMSIRGGGHNADNDKSCLLEIVQFSSDRPNTHSQAFGYGRKSIKFPKGIWRLPSNCELLLYEVYGSIGLENVTLDSSITSSFYLAFGNHWGHFNNDVNFEDLDTEFVTNISNMFLRAQTLDQNLGKWDMGNMTRANGFLTGTAISQENCDKLLLGWLRWENGQPNKTLKPNVTIHLGKTTYTKGGDVEDAFNYYVDTLGWTIIFEELD